MFTIGDFARLGRVSVRMLRHYDAIGLLRPAAVDAASGYRYYRADQLGRLNRVVALKELDEVVVHAAMPVTAGPHPSYDFAVVDLPAVESAATIIHRGHG